MSRKKGTGESDNNKNGGEKEGLEEERAVEGGTADDEEPLEPDEAEAPVDELERLRKENQDLLDGLVRLKAEFDNYRKRMLKEQTRILESAEAGLIARLLPVIDNLERALSSDTGEDPSGMKEGIRLVLNQFIDILAREGLEVVDPQGEPFDPNHHEAMMVVETDECPEDTVIEVIRKGYRLNGTMLRPAMVKVSCPVRE